MSGPHHPAATVHLPFSSPGSCSLKPQGASSLEPLPVCLAKLLCTGGKQSSEKENLVGPAEKTEARVSDPKEFFPRKGSQVGLEDGNSG